MKIAINCIFFQPQGGGIKEYIYNLVSNLDIIDKDNEYVLYVLENYLDFAKNNLPPKFKIKTVPYGESLLEKIKRSVLSSGFWSKEEKSEKFAIFHSPFFYSPTFKKAKIVITVHDLRFHRFPFTYNFPRLLFLKYAVPRSLQKANSIISISNFTKREIIDAFKIDSGKIIVIHEAINREKFSEKELCDYILPSNLQYLCNKRILLSVGHLEPRKNYDRLLYAFKSLKKRDCNADVVLVIIGRRSLSFKKTLKLVYETEDVLYLDFVERKMLLWFYKNCHLFLFPSYYEGFGFPPLEAACFGKMAIISNVASMPEVCGDCAEYFDPFDVTDIENTIQKCLGDSELRRMKESMLEQQLNKFSWEKNAIETLKIYKQICNDV